MSVSRERPVATELSWREEFMDELGWPVLGPGVPPAAVRVFGWLVVGQPPEQQAREIQSALALSAGSVSNSVRTLEEAGMVEHVTHPGDRHLYYRVRRGSWERAVEARLAEMAGLRQVAERAIAASGGQADGRIAEMRDVYAWFEARLGDLVHEAVVVAGGEGSSHLPGP